MITYPSIFFAAGNGKVQEDFDDYSLGALPSRSQGWQHADHQWLQLTNPNRYAGFTWKDYGVSGAFDDWDGYSVGTIDIENEANLYGRGNFDIRTHVGFSAPFYRDALGNYASADQLKGYDYINFNWGADAPFGGYKTDSWSARFIGKLTLPISGTYRLYVERDQACRIYVGKELGPETLIFDQWGTTVPVTMPVTLEPSNTFTFDSGNIDILIKFYEDTGLSKLRLYWSRPAVPGGGPVTPPAIILPSDFGNTGYVRVYAPYVGYEDQGSTNLDFQGAYRTGYVWTDRFTDDSSRNVMTASGNYSYGIEWFDKAKSEGRTSLSHAGYYLGRYVPHAQSDQGAARVRTEGFYAYKSAFATAEELASNTINSHGHYAYKSVTLYDRHFSKVLMDASGTYVFGLITPDAKSSRAATSVSYEGFYANRYLTQREGSQGTNSVYSAGNYFSRYFYTQVSSEGQVNLRPSGYYITGHVNHREGDNARNSISPAGHKVYHQVTGGAYNEDEGRTTLNSAGFYVERFVVNDASADLGLVSLNPYGDYYPRYLNSHFENLTFNQLSPLGIYYSIYANTREQEPAYNYVQAHGYHAFKNVHAYDRDYSRVTLNPAGHHITGWVFTQNVMQYAKNLIGPAGNYFYAIHTFALDDAAANYLSFTDSYYRSIFSYTRDADYGYGQISPQGLYYFSRVYNDNNDVGYNRASLDGNYISRFVENYSLDHGRNTLVPSGHYAQGYVYSNQTEIASNQIQMQGNTFYRYATTRDINFAAENLNLEGIYFGRYAYAPALNFAAQTYQMRGDYYPRYTLTEFSNSINGLIRHDGSYYSRYRLLETESQARAHINLDGTLTYSRVASRDVEPAYNLLGFQDSTYFSAIVYPQIERNYSLNALRFDGLYIRDVWVVTDSALISINFASELYAFEETTDTATLSASFLGSFEASNQNGPAVSTLDYWLEFYRRPTYNMGDSQRYFSI